MFAHCWGYDADYALFTVSRGHPRHRARHRRGAGGGRPWLLLSGTLGAGKTTLTQGIAWGLGADEYARSPTFVLVNEYAARLPIYHMDLYRLDSFAEVDGAWTGRLPVRRTAFASSSGRTRRPGYFPEEHLSVEIAVVSNDERALTLSGSADRHASLFRGVG